MHNKQIKCFLCLNCMLLHNVHDICIWITSSSNLKYMTYRTIGTFMTLHMKLKDPTSSNECLLTREKDQTLNISFYQVMSFYVCFVTLILDYKHFDSTYYALLNLNVKDLTKYYKEQLQKRKTEITCKD